MLRHSITVYFLFSICYSPAELSAIADLDWSECLGSLWIALMRLQPCDLNQEGTMIDISEGLNPEFPEDLYYQYYMICTPVGLQARDCSASDIYITITVIHDTIRL